MHYSSTIHCFVYLKDVSSLASGVICRREGPIAFAVVILETFESFIDSTQKLTLTYKR